MTAAPTATDCRHRKRGVGSFVTSALVAALLFGSSGQLVNAAGGEAAIRRADGGPAPSFSDGSRGPTRRVFAYTQADGVRAFTDRRPAGQRYTVMEFSCFACDPKSRVNWRATSLHTQRYNDEIAAAAVQTGVDAALIRAVMHAESGFNPYARSPKGAAGLMQLMPATARAMGVSDVHAPAENIRGGAKYLARLLAQYDGNVTLALAAYNAGPARVDRYGGVPPFAETRVYVERVKTLHQRYKSAG